MGLITTAKIIEYDYASNCLVVRPSVLIDREIFDKEAAVCELRLDDGRSISAEQRRKIFAIINEISLWSGHDPEYLRQHLTWEFCGRVGVDYFSLSSVDMTTAKEFINFLIEFCFIHSVPTKDTLLNRTEDTDRYLYTCLYYRKCLICNGRAELHHVDRVGMGFDREQICHIGLRAEALCRIHHTEAHTLGQSDFDDKYHIYGIQLDKKLCEIYNLKKEV